MRHFMRLKKSPFERIKNGKKEIEVRLFDEKRQKVKVNDEIEFSLMEKSDEKILVRVLEISRFNSFRELFNAFEPLRFGHPEGITVDEQIERERKHYSEERERKYGVVGLHIKVL